mgnify:FL=1
MLFRSVWSRTIPYARRYAARAMEGGLGSLPEGLADLARALGRLPVRADELLGRIRLGRATLRVAPSPETRRMADGLRRAVDRLGVRVLGAGLLIAGALLFSAEGGRPAGKIFMITGGLALLLSLRGR